MLSESSEDTRIYRVLVNVEEQYSIWPDGKQVPSGWQEVGKSGSKSECLTYVKKVWVDMRPRSLKERMAK